MTAEKSFEHLKLTQVDSKFAKQGNKLRMHSNAMQNQCACKSAKADLTPNSKMISLRKPEITGLSPSVS